MAIKAHYLKLRMGNVPDGLWPQFENLFLDHYIPNFWSLEDIDLPYGRVMVIDPDDMPSMLWRGDLTKVDSYDTVLKDIKNIEDGKNIPVGFCFSSSWQGDVESFKKHVSKNGFHKKMSFHWLVKDIRDCDDDMTSGFIIERIDDPRLMADMMSIGFDEATSRIFVNGALKNIDDPTRGHFVARDPENKNIIGCAAATFHENLAYMSCLAVHPDYRRKSIAKDLVKARIKFLRENNVNFITTAVFEKNNKSMQVQLNAGYDPLEITEYWMQT